jgi:hypothetical protein
MVFSFEFDMCPLEPPPMFASKSHHARVLSACALARSARI